MSDATMRDAMVRMATDADFARRVREDGPAVAREHGLSATELSALQALDSAEATAGPDRLGERLSKSGLFGAGIALSAVGNLGAAVPAAPDGLLCDGHSFVCNGHGLVCDGHSFVCDGHSFVCNGHSFVCNGHPLAPDTHGLLCDGHSLLCNGHSFVCNGHPLAPDTHGLLCDGHSLLCDGHAQSHTAAGDHTAPAVHGDSHTKAGVVRCNGHAIAGIQCNGHPVAAAIECNGHPTAGIQCNGHPTAAEVEPGVKLSSATGDAQLHPPVVGLPSVHSLLSPPTGPEGTAK